MMKKSKNNKAQTILEFTFCSVVVLLMLWGTMMVFRWAGLDLAARRQAHDATISNPGISPREQVYPVFHQPLTMNAIWDGN